MVQEGEPNDAFLAPTIFMITLMNLISTLRVIIIH